MFRQASWLDLKSVYQAKTVREFDSVAIVKQCVGAPSSQFFFFFPVVHQHMLHCFARPVRWLAPGTATRMFGTTTRTPHRHECCTMWRCHFSSPMPRTTPSPMWRACLRMRLKRTRSCLWPSQRRVDMWRGVKAGGLYVCHTGWERCCVLHFCCCLFLLCFPPDHSRHLGGAWCLCLAGFLCAASMTCTSRRRRGITKWW